MVKGEDSARLIPVADQSDSDDDDSDNEGVCSAVKTTWRIVPNGSVYDAGLLHIITLCKKPACAKTFYMLLSILFQVCLNAYLQMTFTSRIWTMLSEDYKEKKGLVFAAQGGACAWQPASAYTNDKFDLKYAGTQPENWDCGPLFPTLFSNVSWLDVNKDGYWSEKDDMDKIGRDMVGMFSNGGLAEKPKLCNAFDGFMDEIRNEQFVFQLRYKRDLGKQSEDMETLWSSAKYTSNYTRIPMKWMEQQQASINLCNNVDPHLCGNLEVRGILNLTVDQEVKLLHGHSNSWKRVDRCRYHYDRCVKKFGEIFLAYTNTQREACGEIETTLEPQSSVLISRYSNPDNYDPKTNGDAIGTLNYQSFLLLILVVWGLAMLDELRQVLSWWMVMLLIPCSKTVVEDDDDKIQVKSISCINKLVVVVLVLIPRTIVVVLMSYIGTRFLIETDDYSELILNAVGMGFLMEMDEMIFNGLASDQGKDDIDKLENIEGEHSTTYFCLDVFNHAMPFVLVVTVVLAVLYPEVDAFTKSDGKIALTCAYNCLCHMEGSKCIAAQILRGATRVPRDLF